MPTVLLRILTALALALTALVAAPAPLACACDCADVDTAEALQESTAVFAGSVVSSTQARSGRSDEPVAYTIAVTRVYRGRVPAMVIVTSAASSASCGAELAGAVTVFAQGPATALTTSSCSAPLNLDRTLLGAGYPPEGPASPSPTPAAQPSGPGSSALVMASLAGLVVVAGLGVWLLRRKRP